MANEAVPRENCFDFIRLIAAVSVVIAHGVRHLNAPFLGIPAQADVLHEGVEGVRVFFVLSGLLVFMSALKCLENGRPIRSFFANRFLRVAPAIYVYAIVSTAFLMLLGALTISQVVSKTHLAWLAGNLLLFPLYFPPEHREIGVGVLNGSLWTIPVEVSFYLVVPLFALWYRNGREVLMWGVIGAIVVGATALNWYLQRANPGWFQELGPEPPIWVKLFVVSLPPWMLWFGLGIFWYRNWQRSPQGIGWFVGAVFAYIFLSFVFFEALSPLGPVREVLYGLPLSYAAVWFGFKGPAALRDLSKLGDLSYGVYVWHMVVINVMLYLNLANKQSTGNPALVPGAVAITLVLAWLSWWLVERPALRRKPYSSRQAGETAQP